MRSACAAVILGLLLGTCAPAPPSQFPPETRLMCDSPEVEEAAFTALDYINSQHTSGYKYALNRIEEVKVKPSVSGGVVYILELDLLQTTCHSLDPTPVKNCTVRLKQEMTVEGDCDVAVSKVGGELSVKAFKCKSKPDSREYMCGGCLELLPLNHTEALGVVNTTLGYFNLISNETAVFGLLEVSRLASQIVSGGPMYHVEYAIVETNCSSIKDDDCAPLNYTVARYGFCKGSTANMPGSLQVKCNIFQTTVPLVDPAANDTELSLRQPLVSLVRPLPPFHPRGLSPAVHGHMHHKLTLHHDPSVSGLLSESNESGEVPTAAVPITITKRESPLVIPEVIPELPLAPGIQICPGRIRHF